MPSFDFENERFEPGELRQSDADRLNDMVRELAAILRINVDAPLGWRPHGGSYSLTCDLPRLAVQDDRYSTLLTADLDVSTTTVLVQSFALFPATNGYYIKIDDEVMLVTAGAGTTTWTVTRAQGNFGAAEHAQWARVSQVSPPITTTLASGLSATATSMTVTGTGTGYFPSEDRFYAIIDTEIVYVTKTSGTTWTIERAALRTVAASHSGGATVTMVLFDENRDVDRIIFADSDFVQPGGAEGRIAVHREVQQFVRLTSGPDANGNYTGYLQKWDDVNNRHVDDIVVYWRNVN